MQKRTKTEQKPINVVVSKREVISDIPTLEHGVPKGKSGKDHRILTNEIRENEQALLQMLEEANELSTESSDNSEIERKQMEKHRKDRKFRRVTKPGSSALLVLLSLLVPLFEGLVAHLGPLPSTSSWGCFCRGILLSGSGTCTALRVSF